MTLIWFEKPIISNDYAILGKYSVVINKYQCETNRRIKWKNKLMKNYRNGQEYPFYFALNRIFSSKMIRQNIFEDTKKTKHFKNDVCLRSE